MTTITTTSPVFVDDPKVVYRINPIFIYPEFCKVRLRELSTNFRHRGRQRRPPANHGPVHTGIRTSCSTPQTWNGDTKTWQSVRPPPTVCTPTT